MTKKSLLIGGAIVAVVAVVGWVGMSGKAPEPAPQPTEAAAQSAPTVTVETPVRSMWEQTVPATGWISAWQESVISAEVAGQTITAINADVGDMVKKGDLLVELSRETIQNQISQRRAALDAAQAQLDQASADADRARRLNDANSVALSQQQTTEYLVAERKAQAEVASAQAQLDSAELDLKRTHIHALTDGRITQRSALLGDVVTQGAELFRLIRDNRIEWHAEVPLMQAFGIREGTPVTIPTPIGEVTGKVRRVSPTASDTNGRITVFVALDPIENAPDPMVGIMISGSFHVGASEALHVPASAVVLQDGFSYVFVLNPDDPTHVLRERVETGRQIDDRIEIIGAIDDTAQIVQAGGSFLTEGSAVTVVSGQGAAE
ncbi:efflux RND transporter periplasmic adaptor subunit [Pseudoprimorskyibacter insulae]|uniref:Macrolide export protein MacA n=1 Tax=Pseudoprimorskyibacter insulae TaxID=1695997 RepID=A0A2R8B0G7_9RHOB|nr:efflux RND transporter periplasmic adaptor subunit [Pseudoprimorskyibacter insulae]SPF81707.1 Macrolide export protein MacA [Pseudoprimorskyibacter insulae]